MRATCPARRSIRPFYRPHKRTTYEKWAASAPPDFRFAVKLPKSVTHEKHLRGCKADIDRFIDEIGGLGDRLGVVLLQLPPSLAFDAETTSCFLDLLRDRGDCAIALEARHASWASEDAQATLRDRGVAGVAADPARFATDAKPYGSGALAYFRFHGSPTIYRSGYDEAALAQIAERLSLAAETACEVWCILDNTAEGHALGNAVALDGRLRSR